MTKEYKIHPLAKEFDMMGESEIKTLADDIKANGLQVPITRKDNVVWDGRNRLKACEKAGVPPRFVEPPPGIDAATFIISANINRRHMSAADRRRVTAKLLKLNPGKSDREIAKATKQDKKTVAKVRRQEEDVGAIPHVDTRTDSKGRQQPASKPKLVASPPVAPAPIQAPEVSIEDRKAQHAVLEAPPEDRPLNEFKHACNHWVPKMNKEQVVAAVAYLQQCIEANELKRTTTVGNA
jgi:ParB-like chromosome segregation protein Spo0J